MTFSYSNLIKKTFFLGIDNHPISVNFNLKHPTKIRDMRNCRKNYTLWLENKKVKMSINFVKFSTLYKVKWRILVIVGASKQKNVVYGEDSANNVYRDLEHAKKCIGYSHNILFK